MSTSTTGLEECWKRPGNGLETKHTETRVTSRINWIIKFGCSW